ncbi:MAG: hypothetical protein GF344_12970, partial [Chitinivibrionales bacterium]|nr:hypothetical protein [Chitinivibrionales bacterium]
MKTPSILFALLAALLLTALSCRIFGPRDNPLDPDSPDYQYPSLSFDSTVLAEGDTIVIDTLTLVLSGNHEANVFRWRIEYPHDTTEWSPWEGRGELDHTIAITGVGTGPFSLHLQTAYDPVNGDITDSIVALVKWTEPNALENSKPFFEHVPGKQTVKRGWPLTLHFVASDADSDSLEWSLLEGPWENGAVELNVSGDTAQVTFTCNDSGTFPLKLSVDDGTDSATAMVSIRVDLVSVNSAPIISMIGNVLPVLPGDTGNFVFYLSDADGDSITTLVEEIFNEDSAVTFYSRVADTLVVSLIPSYPGLYRIRASACDSELCDSAIAILTVDDAPVNAPPLYTSVPTDLSLTASKPDTITIKGFDADGDILAFAVSNKESFGAGQVTELLTQDSLVLALWFDEPGERKIHVSLTDNRDTTDTSFSVMITPADTTPPVLVSTFAPDTVVLGDSSTIVGVIATDDHGLEGVRFKRGNDTLETETTGDSLFQANVTGLAPNIVTTITIEAWDQEGNQAYLEIYVRYDPTVHDNTGPIIAAVGTTPSSGSLVRTESIELAFTITDGAGISRAGYSMQDSPGDTIFLTPDSQGKVTIPAELSPGANTFTLWALDDSPQRNKTVKSHTLVLNRSPDLTLVTPQQGEVGVSRKVNFRWLVNDADDDSIFSELLVGLSSTVLEPVALPSVSDTMSFSGAAGRDYYWQVRAWDNHDTVLSGIRTFTVNNPPQCVLTSPNPGEMMRSAPITLRWSGSDDDPADLSDLRYDLYIDTVPEPGNKVLSSSSANRYDFDPVEVGRRYYWRVVVSDGKETYATPVSDFDVKPAASIVSGPYNDTLYVPMKKETVLITGPNGTSEVGFHVAVDGYGNSFQWHRNGNVIDNSNYQTYIPTEFKHGDRYWCVVSNGLGKPDTSKVATLYIAYKVCLQDKETNEPITEEYIM